MMEEQIKYLKDYKQPDYLVKDIYLTFKITPAKEVTVTSSVNYYKNPQTTTKVLILDGTAQLLAIKLNDELLNTNEYILDNKRGHLELLVNLANSFNLTITTKLKPSLNKTGMGLYCSKDAILTQCEAEGFREITFYQDRPDVLAIWTTEIITPLNDYTTVLSNGNLIKQTKNLSDNELISQWHDPFKKPSYLFALVVGNLIKITDNYLTKSNRNVKLEVYASADNIAKCDHALSSLKKAFAWDEERFNLEYDLDLYMIVATSDFNMGAMENKGLNIFNSKYVLATPKTATDNDFMSIEAVIGHEYFHNWTGNRVTCRDWFQLSLKEGLTVFRENEFSSDMHNRGVRRINNVKYLRAAQFTVDASPLAHNVRPESYLEINNFYTTTIYEKGSEVVKMYQTILGKDKFNQGLQAYLAKYDGQAATCEDFLSAMQGMTELNLSQFMLWYSQAGTPTVSLITSYDSKTKKLTLDFSQKLVNAADGQTMPMLIPITLGLINSQGYELNNITPSQGAYTLTDTGIVLLLNNWQNSFVFENLVEKPILSILRDFSAPINLDYTYTMDELYFLSKYDRDEFNKYESLNRLFVINIKNIYTDLTNNINQFHLDTELTQCLRNILGDINLSSELKATLLQLPSIQEILPQIDKVKIDCLDKALQLLARAIGYTLLDSFMEAYELNLTHSYKFSDHGKRSLKNLCLFYIIKALELNLPKDNTLQLIETMILGQYNSSDNMSDELGVLFALNDSDISLRVDIFQRFYNKWQDEELVMDKYLALHATSRLITIEQLNKLMVDKVFIATNPNKIYALLVSFTTNLIKFHTEEGYSFIANNIILIDRFNPQVASRLANGFSSCSYLDIKYQRMAKASLARILTNQISKNVYEIVTKVLTGLE